MSITKISWEIEVPIFRHPLILRQLAIAIGLPFGLVMTVLVVTAGTYNRVYALYALGLIGAAMVLTVIMVLALYGGKYAVGFLIDDMGVRCFIQKIHARRNRYLNNLTIMLGLLSEQPTVAGAGMLAASRQSVLIRWNKIRTVRFNSKTNTIEVRGGYLEKIAVFCTPADFERIQEVVQSRVRTINS